MKKNPIQTRYALFAIVIANLIWGAAPPIFKWAMASISPHTLGFLRFFLAAVVMLPFAYKDLLVDKKNLFLLMLTAFISVPLHIGLFLVGLEYAPSLNVPIIGAAGPVFTIIVSYLLFHEKIQKKVAIGTVVSLIGVLIIVLRPIIDTGLNGSVFGNLLFVLSTLTGVVHLFLIKRITKVYSPKTVTFWTFFFGSFFFLPLAAWEWQTVPNPLVWNQQSLIGIVFGSLLSSGLAWFLLAYATERLSPNDISVFSYISPIATALVALPLLSEKITFSYLLGAVFVFSGIFIAEAKIHMHQVHPPHM